MVPVFFPFSPSFSFLFVAICPSVLVLIKPGAYTTAVVLLGLREPRPLVAQQGKSFTGSSDGQDENTGFPFTMTRKKEDSSPPRII